ncbi:MAG: DUF4172 domain-containing protein [Daejeonella sp.]
MYIHQLKDWPSFTWDTEAIHVRLGEVRHRQGRILGLMSSAGSKLQENAVLKAGIAHLWFAVLKKTASARSALAEMKGAAASIPNENILTN